VSSVGCAHEPERAVDFTVVPLDAGSGETLPDSVVVDRAEGTGVALAPAAGEPGDVGFAGEGLEPDSDVTAEPLRSADPDDRAVLPPGAAFGAGPTTGGMPNPAGETGRPAAPADDADDVDAAAVAPDAVDEEAVPGADAEVAPRVEEVGAADAAPGVEVTEAVGAAGRDVDACDAAPDDVGAVAPLPAESLSTGPSGSNNWSSPSSSSESCAN
jgi:hypothetical protein